MKKINKNRTILTTEDASRGGRERWKNIPKEERRRRMKLTRLGKKHMEIMV